LWEGQVAVVGTGLGKREDDNPTNPTKTDNPKNTVGTASKATTEENDVTGRRKNSMHTLRHWGLDHRRGGITDHRALADKNSLGSSISM
jgi:hypothetical protein